MWIRVVVASLCAIVVALVAVVTLSSNESTTKADNAAFQYPLNKTPVKADEALTCLRSAGEPAVRVNGTQLRLTESPAVTILFYESQDQAEAAASARHGELAGNTVLSLPGSKLSPSARAAISRCILRVGA